MEENYEPTKEQILADLNDPETIEGIKRSMDDVRRGRVLPYRILGPLTLLNLPNWVVSILFRIAPYTYGRKIRKFYK